MDPTTTLSAPPRAVPAVPAGEPPRPKGRRGEEGGRAPSRSGPPGRSRHSPLETRIFSSPAVVVLITRVLRVEDESPDGCVLPFKN